MGQLKSFQEKFLENRDRQRELPLRLLNFDRLKRGALFRFFDTITFYGKTTPVIRAFIALETNGVMCRAIELNENNVELIETNFFLDAKEVDLTTIAPPFIDDLKFKPLLLYQDTIKSQETGRQKNKLLIAMTKSPVRNKWFAAELKIFRIFLSNKNRHNRYYLSFRQNSPTRWRIWKLTPKRLLDIISLNDFPIEDLHINDLYELRVLMGEEKHGKKRSTT